MDSGQQLENQEKDSENVTISKERNLSRISIDEQDEIFVINSSFTDDDNLNLREHAPMTYLLKNVPKYGQKGFRTFDIKLTCVAALTEYIALGSNVGIVYLYHRKEHNLLRLRSEGYTGPITCIQMCKSIDYMIAAGTKDGRIFCHQIPRIAQSKMQDATVIRGIHKESITCLEWSQNAEKIFSGDADGVVVCTIIQYGETISSSSTFLVQENYPIVQLSYSYRKLLIGSTFRSVIYNPSNSSGVQQIGQHNRKELGKYGITFLPLHSSTYNYALYTARPNLHLWKCSSTGEVIETILLKDTIKDSLSTIPLLQTSISQKEHAGLGLLKVYSEKYLISWNERSLIIIDANRKTIAGSCWDLNNVIDLSVCGDEIFILQQDFNLIRLANHPEIMKKLPDPEEDKLLKAIVTPFKQLETSWRNLNIFEKEVSDKSENENNLFSWLKRSTNNTNQSSETSEVNEIEFSLNPLKSVTLNSDCKIMSTENNSEVIHNIENDFVLKQELNKSEFTSSTSSEQPDNSKVDFSHIKIDETDEIVCTKTKRIKKKNKQPKDPEEDKLLKETITSFKQHERSWRDLNTSEKDGSDKLENENSLFSGPRRNASNTNLSSETSEANEMQFSLKSIASAENNSKVTSILEENNFVSKQELNKSEFTSNSNNEQSVSFKVDFSHIKIDETDEIVCTKMKRIKKKHKQQKGTKEVMSSSTSSLEQSILLENETAGKTNIETTSYHEDILNKEDDSLDSKTDTDSSNVTENNSLRYNTNEENAIMKPENRFADFSEGNKLSFNSLSNLDSNISSETYMDSILDTILSRYEVKEDKISKNDEIRTEESVDGCNLSEHANTDSAQIINSSGKITNTSNKTKLTKIQLDRKSSTQSIQSPEYNVYARSTSTTDSNVKITDKSKSVIMENASNDNTSSDDDDKPNEINKKILTYPDIWARDRFPSAIISLAVCSKFLFCIDNKNMLYYTDLSGGLSWTTIDQDVNQIAVSPTGKVVWILRKEVAYAGVVSKVTDIHSIAWMKVTHDVQYIAVDSDYAWYIKSNGELHIQQNMFTNSARKISKKVTLQHPVNHVACCNGVVCVLTNKGKLFYRTGITDYRPEGLSWQEIELGQRLAINLTIGANVLWIIDHLGSVWFLYDITEVIESKCESHRWWQVDMSELLYEDSHRSLQRMNAIAASIVSPVVVLPKHLVFLNEEHQPCIGACDKGVWFSESLGRYLFSNKREIVGHRWRKVILKATSASFSWKYISASGMSLTKGAFWGILSNDDFLCFTDLEQPPIFIHPPNTRNKICCITAAQEALWVLTSVGDIYVRNGISPSHPEGTHWVKLNLAQLSNNRLVHISCGENAVWGCDCTGTVFLRVGSLKAPAANSLHQAWVALDVNMNGSEIHNQHSSYGSSTQIHITKVYTGHNGHIIWALDKKNNIYVREGIFPELPIGTGWVYAKGIQAKELCIGGTYVWAVTLNNDIYCRYGITDKNYIGDYWKKLPGNVTSLSVTSDCRLWAIGPNQVLYEHRMHALNHQQEVNTTEASKKQEDGWELL